jgi:hypothetical protein
MRTTDSLCEQDLFKKKYCLVQQIIPLEMLNTFTPHSPLPQFLDAARAQAAAAAQ